MKVRKSVEFRAESLRQIGLISCSPLALKILNLLLKDEPFTKLIHINSLFCIFLFFIGMLTIERALDILLEKEELLG